MADVVVVGAGVAGLGAALALSRRGHAVTLLERDATPLPPDATAAFSWDRRGAPQVRHSHAFLARLRNLLRDRHPDVLADLLAAGATEIRFTELLPDTMADRAPRPGDDDLVALACRRTTFEWVLRRAVLADGRVTLLDGTAAAGLRVEPGDDGPPVVTGVVAGQVLPSDWVVVATGRRTPLPRWLADAGVELEVTEEDTGIVYLSRFYELHDGAAPPPTDGPIGGDLGYLKYAVFQGDNRTFSVTFAVATDDAVLRPALLDPATFDAAARVLPATAPWADPALSEAITGVEVMAGLVNRRTRFLDGDGQPRVVGLLAVGDAHTCTNPLYGRGCSLGMVMAELAADALDAHPDDGVAASVAYEQACRREIIPWYRAAVAQDRSGRIPDAGDAPDGEAGSMRSLLRDGLVPAMRTDPVVFRAFLRSFNLLDPPEALMADPAVVGPVLEAFQARDDRPPEPPLGPGRAELLAALSIEP